MSGHRIRVLESHAMERGRPCDGYLTLDSNVPSLALLLELIVPACANTSDTSSRINSQLLPLPDF